MMKTIKKIFTLLLVALVSLGIVGCGKDSDNVSITFEASKTTLSVGETATLTVTVSGSKDTSYTYVISDPSLVAIENDVLSVTGNPDSPKNVTIIAYANADASKTVTKVFTINPEGYGPKVQITTNRYTITYGEQITLSVKVTGFENSAYAWVVSDTSLVKIENNVLSVVKEVTVDTDVTIKAVSVEDQSVYDEKVIIVKAPSSLGSITISASQDTISEGETVMLSALVLGLPEAGYTWQVSNDSLVKIEGDMLTLIGTVKVDTNITITAIAIADESVFKSKTITVKAPIIAGQVGELTNSVLAEVANSNITFSGTVTDYYNDLNNSFNSSVQQYDSLVMMSDGRWFGSWNVKGKTSDIVEDNYRRGDTDGLRDQYGNIGHALERLYIDINNQVASEVVKDYMSVPAIWEAQHLWNHLGNLVVTNFVYDVEDEVYTYTANQNDMDALYLMTYLSYCLTPMLSDTLNSISFTIVDGHITKVTARTEILYYGSETSEDADAMSYTEVELIPSNIGTTVVPNPTPYATPEHADLLNTAINNMKNLTNYTYQANDTTTYAPSGDAGDYEISSASVASDKTAKYRVMDKVNSSTILNAVQNYQSSVGTVGEVGYVTSDAILIAKTGKYSYSLDDKLYHTEYSGYKQNTDGTYDEFEYNTSLKALNGTRKVKGTLADILPDFNFSADIFSFVGTSGSGENKLYIFELKATDVTREVAMNISMHSYAEDAEKSTNSTLTLKVTEAGYIVNSTYAYNLSGVYYGNISTTYGAFGTTTLPEDTFGNYIPRVWRTTWDQYICKYYQPTHTGNSYEENAQVAFDAIFGNDAKDLPNPQIFLEVFDDMIFGPFFDWRSTEENGVTVYTDYFSINVQSSEFDENSRITNYEEIINELITGLQEQGYTLDSANTDTSGGETGLRDRYVTLTKGNIEIVITNNHTKHLSIYFYHLGDWILK